jgi:hypothetical protein
MRISFIICGAGIGLAVAGLTFAVTFAASGLAPVIGPSVFLFGVGLGLIVGGIFRTLRHIQAQINEIKKPREVTQNAECALRTHPL